MTTVSRDAGRHGGNLLCLSRNLTVQTRARSLQEALHPGGRHDQLALQYRPIQDIFQQFPGFNVGFVGQVRLETEIQIHINRLIAGGLGG